MYSPLYGSGIAGGEGGGRYSTAGEDECASALPSLGERVARITRARERCRKEGILLEIVAADSVSDPFYTPLRVCVSV